MLVEHLPELKGAGVALGAGWGYLAAHVLKAEAVTKLDMIEADHLACVAARENITDPRAQISWGDALAHKGAYDFVVMNPPFHAARSADPTLGQAFLRTAAQALHAQGQLWMVANINLPYEQTLLDHFRHMQIVARGGGFKIITARGPKSARTGR
jgi:16S rRNA (guanine1207-N2)-methyltransferase